MCLINKWTWTWTKPADKASQGRSSRPGPITTPSRTGLWPLGHSRGLSASLRRTPNAAAISPHPPQATEHELATHLGEEPAFASTSDHVSMSTPPLAAKSYPQPWPNTPNNPLPYTWPAAPPYMASPPLTAQAPASATPPSFPPLLCSLSSPKLEHTIHHF